MARLCFTFVDSGQFCLAKVCYEEISEHKTLWSSVEVNEAFYSYINSSIRSLIVKYVSGANSHGIIPGLNKTVLRSLPRSVMLIEVESVLMGAAFMAMIIVRIYISLFLSLFLSISFCNTFSLTHTHSYHSFTLSLDLSLFSSFLSHTFSHPSLPTSFMLYSIEHSNVVHSKCIWFRTQ